MKTLSNILKANYGDIVDGSQLPTFTEGTIITAVMDKGRAVPCKPQTFHNIRCPMCGSSEGYKVFDDGAYWWACRRRECIAKNAGQAQTYVAPQPDITDLMRSLGVTPRLLDASFDTWRHSEEMKKELMQYARKPQEALTFTGTNGVGKSFCAVAIMREYYERNRQIPIFYNVSTLYQDWLSQVSSPVKLMYKLTNAPFLVLDDLGIRTPSDAFCDFIYLIINSRYADMKGTVVTTNLTTDELVEKFGKAIVSRLFGGEKIHLKGDDRRLNF